MKSIYYFICSLFFVVTSCQQNNCSDEVLEEFLQLDSSIQRSNVLLQYSIDCLIAEMHEMTKTKTQYQVLLDKAKAVRNRTDSTIQFIDALQAALLEQAGGVYTKEEAISLQKPHLKNRIKNLNNRTAVNAILLTGTHNQATVLDQKIQWLKKNYRTFLENLWDQGGIKGTIFADPAKKKIAIDKLIKELQLYSSQDYNQQDKLSWATFTFGDRPLAAVLPMIQTIKGNILQSEYEMIHFLIRQLSYMHMHYDFFDIFAQSQKPSIQLGETYEAEIALGTYASENPLFIMVNGDTMDTVDGRVTYKVCPKEVGEQSYTAKIVVKNPASGVVETLTKQFYFEVTPSLN